MWIMAILQLQFLRDLDAVIGLDSELVRLCSTTPGNIILHGNHSLTRSGSGDEFARRYVVPILTFLVRSSNCNTSNICFNTKT